MKKLLTSALLLVFLLSLLAVPAFSAGADTYPYLTFEDSEDFTIVAPRISYEAITARGLDENFEKQVISDPWNISWSSSDSNVAWVVPSSGATVYVLLLNEGRATVTASYTCADNTVITCHSNVVVERRTNPVNLVQTVNVTVTGDEEGSGLEIDETVNVPLFSLADDVFDDREFNDDDVLTMDPTALHALLYVLELKLGDGQIEPNWQNWNWTWVKENVEILSEGSYVFKIDVDEAYDNIGWQYKVNNVDLGEAASIARLTGGETVDWFFDEYQ